MTRSQGCLGDGSADQEMWWWTVYPLNSPPHFSACWKELFIYRPVYRRGRTVLVCVPNVSLYSALLLTRALTSLSGPLSKVVHYIGRRAWFGMRIRSPCSIRLNTGWTFWMRRKGLYLHDHRSLLVNQQWQVIQVSQGILNVECCIVPSSRHRVFTAVIVYFSGCSLLIIAIIIH